MERRREAEKLLSAVTHRPPDFSLSIDSQAGLSLDYNPHHYRSFAQILEFSFSLSFPPSQLVQLVSFSVPKVYRTLTLMYINPVVVNRVVEIASRGSAMLVSFSQPMAELLECEH